VGSSSPATWPGQPLSRRTKAWVTITYTAGFTPATMPGIISDTAILLLSSILSRRQNPTGADQINLADKNLVTTLRGDPSGDSLLVKEVKQNLARYIRKAF
jgi:hypothetical protein